MKKDIKYYLHFYLGCEAMYGGYGDPERIVTISGIETKVHDLTITFFPALTSCKDKDTYSWFKPILRPLCDMTEEEARQIFDENFGKIISRYIINAISIDDSELYTRVSKSGGSEAIRKLLSKGFDLFGLIEAGLAIDKTKIKTYGTKQ